MRAIVNGTLVMPDHLVPGGVVLIEGDRIRAVGAQVEVPEGAEILDASGKFVGPGLIDIHTHAGGEFWLHENPQEACRFHLSHGTTTLLAALYFNLDQTQYLQAISTLREERKRGAARILEGLYMEGPYLNPKFGADREHNPWRGALDPAAYRELLCAARDLARVWCVAPEREGIEDFVRMAKEQIPQLCFAVAHSEASPQQIEALMPYGLRVGTHHTNATGDRQKYPECRGVCVDEAVNYHSDIYAELICDSRGIHVDPYMLRLILRIKGKERIILISDACVFDGPVPPGYEGVTDINFDEAGEIAGSKLSLAQACRNMMVHTGASLCDVFRFASYNPAQLLGLRECGELKAGNLANCILVGPLMEMENVLFRGEMIKKSKEEA